MIARVLLTTSAIGVALALCGPASATTASNRDQSRDAIRDCRPFNGPDGYYGNPWCDQGWKYAEDYPPGAGRHYDVLDLFRTRRPPRRWNLD